MEVRKVERKDLEGIRKVIASSELFPPELLDEMIADYLDNPATEDIWFTGEEENELIAVGYCAPEKFTEGTYNLYAIGVLDEQQGKGVGTKMMKYLEDKLRQQSKRVLIVETSGDPQFNLTRKFYLNLGYEQEATIRDFWQEGEDKIIYWKKL
ncbi:MAG: GNAT family N-acetyltransferase [Bacteroidota bacterium]